MSKKVEFFLLAFWGMALNMSCYNEDSDTYKVAYIARSQGDSFAAWLANSVRDKADKYDNITLTVFDGQASDDVQNAMIENAIVNRFDAIIIQPNNGESQRPYAEKVVEKGIICITTNARIKGIKGASSVDADPYEQAAENARLALTQIPEGASVVVLNGPPGNFHADERRRSWEVEFFVKRPDVVIVGEQIANWNKDEAMTVMEDWVQANERIDAIISMNDNMCAGALEVVGKSERFKNIYAYGVDGTVEGLLLIKEGRMTATTLQSASSLAELLLATCEQLLEKKESSIHADIDNPLVTQQNVDQYIAIYQETREDLPQPSEEE